MGRWLRYLISKLWLVLAGVLVLAALLLTLLRYALPHIPNLASHAETWLATQYQIRADIGAIDAQWSAGGLRVVLVDVSLPPAANSPVDLQLGRLGFRLDLWRSLFNFELVVDDILLAQSELTLYPARLRNDPNTNTANELDAVSNLLLRQLQQFDIRAGVLHIDSPQRPRQTLLIDNLRWLNDGNNHRAQGTFRLSALTENTLAVVIDARGDNWQQLVGDIHLVADDFDVSSWLTERLGQVQIRTAKLNFSSWISFADGRLTQSTLAVEEALLNWQVAAHQQQLQLANGLVQLRPTAAGWAINSTPFSLKSAGQTYTLKPWQATSSGAEQRLQIVDLPVTAIVPHLPLLFATQAPTPAQWQSLDEFVAMASGGALDITLQHRDKDWRWWLNATELGWLASAKIPSIDGLTLEAQGNLTHAKWQLSGRDIALRSDWLDPLAAWDINQIDLRGGWYLGDQRQRWWLLPSSTMTINDAVVELQAQHLRSATSAPLTELNLRSRSALPMLTIQRLLPAVMGTGLQSYLQDALRAGTLTAGHMLWRQQGAQPWLQVVANARELDFKFQPDWPALTEFDALLYANTERLWIHTAATPSVAEIGAAKHNTSDDSGQVAHIAGMQVTAARAEIQGLSGAQAPQLTIAAQVQGNAEQAQPLFAASPLNDSVGEALTTLQLKGPIAAQLALDIPLTAAASDAIRATGRVTFANTKLHLAPIATDVVIEQGQLEFDNDQIRAPQLAVRWQGLPISVSVSGGLAELRSAAAEDYLVDVALRADWQTDALYAAIPELPWQPYLYGAVNWRSAFQLQLPQQGDFQFSWQQDIDFTGLESSLPAPFQKDFGEAWQGRLQVTGGPTALHIGVDLPERLLAQIQLSGDAQQLQHGFVQVGAQQPQQILPNARQFFVNADLSQADVGLWYTVIADVLDTQTASSDPKSGLASFIPDLIQVRSPTLTWAGQTLTDTSIRAFPGPKGWQLELSAQQAAMDILIPRAEAAIQIDAKFLELAPVESLRQTAAAAPDIDLALLPAISFQCRRCQYGSYNLGEVVAEFAPLENGLDIKNVTLKKGANRLQLDGTWLREPAADGEVNSQTTIQGSMTSEDFGALLSEYEITTVVQDSSASLNFNLNWQGTPYEFNEETLSGRVEWVLGEGYLRDVSEGGARLLSILSIEGLLRKLTLDFRDIFSNGMFYTRFGGTLQLENGVATTDDTRLLGSAGDMEIQGRTNLVTETVDYRLVYVPKVTSSLPVILAWMINPPSGLAALLIDKVLHDAQVISRLEYQVSGTMDNPEVKEVRRDSREVEIPQVEPNSATPSESK